MSTRQRRTYGHSMLELLVAAVLGALVVVGSVLLFISGIRLAVKLQTSSQALRAGSTGVERMRFALEEATAALLPDDDSPRELWPHSQLGDPEQYLAHSGGQVFVTAIYISLPRARNVVFRTAVNQTQTVALPSHVSSSRGALIYRGDSDGNPAPSNGTFLWQWSADNRAIVSKTVLCRKLASTPGAVSFRRGNDQNQLLRFRLIEAEKDSYGRQQSSQGKQGEVALETSDYSFALLNTTGSAVPVSALPTGIGCHP